MEDFKPNPNSFHFKLVSAGDRHEYEMPKDFCSYWRSFAWRLFFSFVLTVVALYTIVSPIGLLYYYVQGLPLGGDPWWTGGVFLWRIIIFVAAVLGLAGLVKMVVESILEAKRGTPKKPDGVVKMKYKAWKGKYCPMVDYKEAYGR